MKSKKRFSVYLSKVSFKENVLLIQGKKTLTVITLLAFFIALVYCLRFSAPFLVRLGLQLSIAFVFYGLIEVAFSKSTFIYDLARREVSVHRKALRKRFVYKGSSVGKIRLRRHAVDKSSLTKTYNIELVFENEEASVPYQLTYMALTEHDVQKELDEWNEKLQLS